MSMTVVTGGALVTGEVVHRNVWLQTVQGLMPHPEAQEMIQAIEMTLRGIDAELEDSLEDDLPNAGYLNFLEAFVDGHATPPLRVTLSSVTGWGLGYRR